MEIKLNNIYSYKDFLNEKNQYAVYIDDKEYGKPGDYKIGRIIYNDALKTVEPGTKVDLYKVEDAKGNKIKELKKSEIVTKKQVKDVTLSDVKQAIQQQLLDLFYRVNISSVELIKDEKTKKLTSIKEGDVDIDELFKIKFDVSPMDFAHGVQISKEFKDSIKFNREFGEGTSQKKPYLLIISNIQTEKGVSAFHEDIENIKRKYTKGIELTPAEEDLLLKLKKAESILITGNEKKKFERDSDFTLVFTIKLVKNPDFGGEIMKIKKDEDEDDEYSTSGLSDNFFGEGGKRKIDDEEQQPDIEDLDITEFDIDDEDYNDDDLY